MEGNNAPKRLFGKPVEPQPGVALFGKTTSAEMPSSSQGVFTTQGTKQPRQGIFSLPSTSTGRVPHSALSESGRRFASRGNVFFGKPAEPSSTQSTRPSSKILFGKPVPTTTSSVTPSEAFGRSSGIVAQGPITSFYEAASLSGNKSQAQSSQLFVSRLVSESATGPSTSTTFKPARLFSKSDVTSTTSRSKPWGVKSESGVKRTLTQMEEVGERRDMELVNLETFGSKSKPEDDLLGKKKSIRRTGLFGKALAGVGLDRDVKKRRSDERESAGKGPSSAAVSKRRISASPNEIRELNSIVIKDVPPELNLRGLLVDIFQEFGEVKKVKAYPEEKRAVVHFADHEAAARAKKIRVLKRGSRPVRTFWARTEKAESERRSQVSSEVTDKFIRIDRTPPPFQRRTDKGPKQPSLPLRRKLEPSTTVSPQKRLGITSESKDTKSDTSSSRETFNLPLGSLASLEGRLAKTANERLEILEERDKIVRHERGKGQPLSQTKGLQGDCQDMCPEKERYQREFQRRLSVYEVENIPGKTQKVNHSAAVKEYSRSSADQELPLPSELRPPLVLKMTMNYLMNNIMDQVPDHESKTWGEWYNFLWDRMRSIRKDITQQSLCDMTAVELLEKCTRFHIFCAHHLCEEDTMTFDPKINSENLTKCLQSLKHLYDDLTMKGMECPNEAEFRAYDVLLNLNEGDILRQVQQYRVPVRSSQVIAFSVQAVSAISTRNYVKFFKLMRVATYLNACIMHRYVTQVRNTAIEIMNKAYSTAKGTSYPLSEVLRLLAFENDNEAREFCFSHGLRVEVGLVHLSRSDFFQPDSVIPASRSILIIEAKNDMLVGEIVNGGPLPPNLRHIPTSSFDQKGRFVLHRIMRSESDHEEEETSLPSSQEKTRPATEQVTPREWSVAAVTHDANQQQVGEEARQPPSPKKLPLVVKDIIRELFYDVINEMAREVASGVLDDIIFDRQMMLDIASNVLYESVEEVAKDVVSEIMQDENSKELHRQHKQRLELESKVREESKLKLQKMLQEIQKRVLNDVVDDVVKEETRSLINTERRSLLEEISLSIARAQDTLTSDLVDDMTLTLSKQIAREVIEEEIQIRDEKLAELEKIVRMKKMARMLHRWRKAHTYRLHVKYTLETFPVGPSTQSLEKQVEEFGGMRRRKGTEEEADGAIAPYEEEEYDYPHSIILNREHIAKTILKIHYQRFRNKKKIWEPIDIPKTYGHCLLGVLHDQHNTTVLPSTDEHNDVQKTFPAKHSTQHAFWKLMVSFPSSEGRSAARSHDFEVFCSWLKAKLRRGKLPEKIKKMTVAEVEFETLSLYTSNVGSENGSLSVCTKVIQGTLPSLIENDTEATMVRNHLLGTCGIIFVIENPQSWNNKKFWARQRKRLQNVLYSKPVTPALPLLIYIIGDELPVWAKNKCRECLHLQKLDKEKLVTDVTIETSPGCVDDESNVENLVENLQWLALHYPHPPALEQCSLSEYLDDGLTSFFSFLVRENEHKRRQAGLQEQRFNPVIALYNSVLEHLASKCSSSKLLDISWPPAEFAQHKREETFLPMPEWNSPHRLANLKRFVLALQLPQMEDVYDTDDWNHGYDVILTYIKSLPGMPGDKAPLISRVKWLLAKCKRHFESTCRINFSVDGCLPTADLVPWTSLAETCVTYMVGLIKKDTDENPLSEQVIYYFHSDFEQFQVPAEWMHCAHVTLDEHVSHPDSLQHTYSAAVEHREAELLEEAAQDAEDAANAPKQEVLRDQRPVAELEQEGVAHSAKKLEVLIAREREETMKYEEYLSNILQDSSDVLEGFSKEIKTPESQDNISFQESARGESNSDWMDRNDENLTDSLNTLERKLNAERRASKTAELRLATLLGL